MRKLILLSIVFISCTVYCQTDSEWVLFNSVSGVEFYKKETACTPENIPNQKGILIKIINTNQSEVEVSWELNVWYDGVQHKADIKDGENEYKISLRAGASTQGSCDIPNGALYIFKEFTTFKGGAVMTKFEFDNLKLLKD